MQCNPGDASAITAQSLVDASTSDLLAFPIYQTELNHMDEPRHKLYAMMLDLPADPGALMEVLLAAGGKVIGASPCIFSW
jgi:hypothetical protein